MKVKAIHCLTCGHIIDIEEGKQKQTCNACSNSFILDQEQVQPIYNQKVIINKFGLDSADGNFQQGIYHPNELYEISQKINMIWNNLAEISIFDVHQTQESRGEALQNLLELKQLIFRE